MKQEKATKANIVEGEIQDVRYIIILYPVVLQKEARESRKGLWGE